MGYKIKNLSDLDEDSTREMSRIFMDSFGYIFKKFSRDKELLRECFERSFIHDMIYVAFDEDKVVGFIAYSTCKGRVINVSKKTFCNHFGKIKGSIFSWKIKRIMGRQIVSEANQCYVDFVAVDKLSRRKGVAIELFNYIHEHLIFDEFILNVSNKNLEAQNLYKKLGYIPIKRNRSIITKLRGFGDLIVMKYRLTEKICL